jgi:hypothetical protein
MNIGTLRKDRQWENNYFGGLDDLAELMGFIVKS